MSVITKIDSNYNLFVKGAPEEIYSLCFSKEFN